MDIEIGRKDLEAVRVVDPPASALAHGEARIRIDRFGFSSNNITYAVMGDLLRYWSFFPAAPSAPGEATSWGRLPVWGFGDVVETRSPGMEVGDRLFGYFPMSTELVVQPGPRSERTVSDLAAHRAEMARAYSSYQICASDPLYRPDLEDLQMLLYPLFYTSFLVDDFFVDGEDFGAEQIVLSSASSKTAIGVAWLSRRRGRRTLGLTSASNLGFVESLGIYDSVLTYGDLGEIKTDRSVYVDVAGNPEVTARIHEQVELGWSMIVGDTHWDTPPAAGRPLPGPKPEFLFAPARIAQRSEEWGAADLSARVAAAWQEFATWATSWIELREARGPDEVISVYRTLLQGRVDPRIGHVCRLESGSGARS